MIEHTQGNLLSADAEALVNTVNCVGYMGKGIALQFKQAFPGNFKAYQRACKAEEVQPGRMFVFETGGLVNPRYIINFPTKRHWRGNSRMADIESGLEDLVAAVRRLGIRSIAIPPLGSGLGGLDWQQVRPRIEAAFADLSGRSCIALRAEGRAGSEPHAGRDQAPASDGTKGPVHQPDGALCGARLPPDTARDPEARLFSAGSR